MQANIVYMRGKSCWVGKQRFKLNKNESITNPALIEHCQNTAGFSVEVIKKTKRAAAKPAAQPIKKIIRPVLKKKTRKPAATK